MYRLQIVESIPEGLNYTFTNDTQFMSTYEAWQTLLNISKDNINIGSFYWTMLSEDIGNDTYPSADKGETIFQQLQFMAAHSNITIRIARDITQISQSQDLEILAKNANVQVRDLNLNRLWGSGVLHTKLWLIDNKHFYLGSANMDWRALTQVFQIFEGVS